jgi:hypothetical protein
MAEMTVDEARAKWENAVGYSLKVLGDAQLESDRSLLKVIEALITRVQELEKKVDMLSDLHRLSE